MSVITTFFAFPADVPLRALVGPPDQINEELQYLGRYLQDPLHFGHYGQDKQLDLCIDCVKKHPELPSLQLELGKQSGRFHFLLSAGARGQEPNETERLFDDAFTGCQISDKVVASQGIPLAYLPAPLVERIGQALLPMNHITFGEHWEAYGDADPWAQCTGLHEWFDEFKTFFVESAKFGHAVFRIED